jgi:hypothetical protein
MYAYSAPPQIYEIDADIASWFLPRFYHTNEFNERRRSLNYEWSSIIALQA